MGAINNEKKYSYEYLKFYGHLNPLSFEVT